MRATPPSGSPRPGRAPRRLPAPPTAWLTPLAALASLAALPPVGALIALPPAGAGPMRPAPPPPREVHYDPDQATCRPENLESSFRRQLQPWADQPPAVLERLRSLQLEMLRSSLQRCQQKGLLSAEQARTIEQRLSAAPQAASDGGPAPSPAPPSGQRP